MFYFRRLTRLSRAAGAFFSLVATLVPVPGLSQSKNPPQFLKEFGLDGNIDEINRKFQQERERNNQLLEQAQVGCRNMIVTNIFKPVYVLVDRSEWDDPAKAFESAQDYNLSSSAIALHQMAIRL